MPELHKEIVFESEIVAHLTANGWHEGDAARISAAVTGKIDLRITNQP